jgi:hypothetical protein
MGHRLSSNFRSAVTCLRLLGELDFKITANSRTPLRRSPQRGVFLCLQSQGERGVLAPVATNRYGFAL